MKISKLVKVAKAKERFLSIENYIDFAEAYLEFIREGLQAVIVSRNETKYRFFQYRQEATFNISRPINNELMLSLDEFQLVKSKFLDYVVSARELRVKPPADLLLVDRFIYTCQQCIGACLDALPANESNTARKINGDLFERLIRLVLQRAKIDASDSTIYVPVMIDGVEAFKMSYQHDLIIKVEDETRAIGSVKTSSKDRLDKVFIDKFLYNKLTEKETPHFAVFLNDVQRKGVEGKYGVNSTFLPGHFKGYTIKLNPLDGVYYFDMRPNMITEAILKDHIRPFRSFLFGDLWDFIDQK